MQQVSVSTGRSSSPQSPQSPQPMDEEERLKRLQFRGCCAASARVYKRCSPMCWLVVITNFLVKPLPWWLFSPFWHILDVSYGHRFQRLWKHMETPPFSENAFVLGGPFRCLLAGSLDLQDGHKPLGPCAQLYLGEVQNGGCFQHNLNGGCKGLCTKMGTWITESSIYPCIYPSQLLILLVYYDQKKHWNRQAIGGVKSQLWFWGLALWPLPSYTGALGKPKRKWSFWGDGGQKNRTKQMVAEHLQRCILFNFRTIP